MNRYKLTFILRDGSKIKLTTEKISEELLIKRNMMVLSTKGPLVIKNGSIEYKFMAIDIEKIKYKVLEDE